MRMILESKCIDDYLQSDKYIDYNHPSIQEKAKELFEGITDEKQKINIAFEFVRDEISHSGDIDSERVTKKASEALKYREGICFAKSLLLAALLRYAGVPTGLCYQHLTKEDTPDTGYVLHGLNAVYLSKEDKWVRLDARGNKPGVNAQFSVEDERVAFVVRPEYDEIDYPTIYAFPHAGVMKAFETYNNRKTQELAITRI